MIIALMAAFSATERLGLSSLADRALGLSKQICRVHGRLYASGDELETVIDLALALACITIVEEEG